MYLICVCPTLQHFYQRTGGRRYRPLHVLIKIDFYTTPVLKLFMADELNLIPVKDVHAINSLKSQMTQKGISKKCKGIPN